MTLLRAFLYKNATFITYSYVIGVLALSMLPINGTDSTLNKTYVHLWSEIRLDYLLHGILLVPFMSLRVCYPELKQNKVGIWIVGGFGLAWFAEGVQYFLPYRTYNVIDLLANTLGMGVGIVLWRLVLPFFR